MGRHAKQEEIVAKLRQFEVLAPQSKWIAEAADLIGVSEQTSYCWPADYGSMKIVELTKTYGYYGYRRVTPRLRSVGWVVNA